MNRLCLNHMVAEYPVLALCYLHPIPSRPDERVRLLSNFGGNLRASLAVTGFMFDLMHWYVGFHDEKN